MVTDAVTAQTTFVSATGGGTLSGSVGTVNVGSLAAGASTSFTLTVHVNSNAGRGISTATGVPTGALASNPANNSSTDTDTVSTLADVSITKDDGVTSVTAGTN